MYALHFSYSGWRKYRSDMLESPALATNFEWLYVSDLGYMLISRFRSPESWSTTHALPTITFRPL